MSEEALKYRAKRGVLELDEQMALLIQRVSGATYGNLFYPQLSGVAFSYNPYVWSESIDPHAGVMRLVFGLGTRAVDRADDDYTRVVALNAPDKRPEPDFDKVKRYAQRRVDILDLANNKFTYSYFTDVVKQSPGLPVEKFAILDHNVNNHMKDFETKPWVLTFDNIFSETQFINDMRKMLQTIKNVYKTNIDIEFTTNFFPDGTYKLNLLQCRPLQVNIDVSVQPSKIPRIKTENIVMKACGGVIGQSRVMSINKIIYVIPSAYGNLKEKDRYAVARLIGKLAHLGATEESNNIMIFGPGRWGTSMASLGIPVSFGEINTVSVLCEIDMMHEGLVPDLSLGTHFFNEMVETNILYIAFFKARKDNILNENFLLSMPNHINDVLQSNEDWSNVVRYIYSKDLSDNKRLYLNADPLKQVGILYISK
ncbi:MAG: PEP/pyruvate-binding domain-containing protein, partial [Candidatus Hydrogenedentota bacterium]